MKVLFLTNIPSPYRADFFNELGKFCDLTVTYEGRDSIERDSKWIGDNAKNYRSLFLDGKRTNTDQFLCLGIIRVLRGEWDKVIIGNYSSPTSMLAISYMKMKRIPFIIQADGGLINRSENRIKYLLKKHYISSASSWMSSGKATTDYLTYYGAHRDKCSVYPFTSLWKKDLDYSLDLKANKLKIKKKLGMSEQHIVISVGRFSYDSGYGKGYDLLLKSAEKLEDGIGIYIIGDEPTDEFLKWKHNKNLEHVHYIGFKVKADLLEYYAAADLFVLMTRGDVWGLVINEAMMFGLPIITTDRCVAGLELVQNDINGYIVPINNAEQLAEKITYILKNDKIKSEFGKESLKRIQPYTIENMAKVNMDILKG